MALTRKAVAVATVLAVGAGCAGRAERAETFTLAEAYARVDQHIERAVEVLSPRPELVETFENEMPCTDMANNETGEYLVERHYEMIQGPANAAVFDSLYAYWTSNGYRVTNDMRSRRKAPILQVRHDGDSFSVSLRQNLANQLHISGSSPCVPLADPPSP